MAVVVGRSTRSLAGMKKDIAAFLQPKIPRAALLGMWTMVAVWGIGVTIASVAYLVGHTDACEGLRFIYIGFTLLGIGAILGPAIAFQAWREVDSRMRIFIVVFPLWGIAFVAMMGWFAGTYSKCW